MAKLLDYNFVKEQFEKDGYQLLSKEYVGNRYHLDFICPNGHKYFITYCSFSKGRRCKKCATENLGNLLREDFSYITSSFKNEGYTLLSKKEEYINEKSKLYIKCSKGHEFKSTFSFWKRGNRCPICNFNSRKLTYEFVKEQFEKEGYILLSKEYINNSQKLKYLCPKGHIHFITYAGWSSGQRCGICSNNKTKDISEVKDVFSKEGYTLLSTEYKDNKQKMNLLCPNGHKIKMKFNGFINGNRCGICFRERSKSEKEIIEYIKQIYTGEIIENSRLISPFEIDIELPEKKIAIEYCGLYWHSVEKGKDENYHYNKFKKCLDLDYKLITIFEDEWVYSRDLVKSRLKNIIFKDLKKMDSLKVFNKVFKKYPPKKISIFLDNKWGSKLDYNWFNYNKEEIIPAKKWDFVYDRRTELGKPNIAEHRKRYKGEIYDCGYTKLIKEIENK